jgi:hypothetical protein
MKVWRIEAKGPVKLEAPVFKMLLIQKLKFSEVLYPNKEANGMIIGLQR